MIPLRNTGCAKIDKPLFSKIRNASLARTEQGKHIAQAKTALKMSLRMYD